MARPASTSDNPSSRFLAGLSPHGRWLLNTTLVGAAVVLGLVGVVNNLSPNGTSPALWLLLAVVGAFLGLRLAHMPPTSQSSAVPD